MEIERKFRVLDVSLLREKVVSSGFVFSKNKHQKDTYFVVREKMDDGREKYLRIRSDMVSSLFSLDMHLFDAKLGATEEFEVSVSSFSEMKVVLGKLGLNVVCVVDKKREVFKKDEVVVVLDSVEGLGNFCEIEILGEDVKAIHAKIEKVREELGILEKDEVDDSGYPDLMLALGKE